MAITEPKPRARKEQSTLREARMRALAPRLLEVIGPVVGERKPQGMQMLEVQPEQGQKRIVWVKCAWRPGTHGTCAVQMDFPPKSASPQSAEDVVNLVAGKAGRAQARGATDLLLLAADEDGSTALAAFLVPIEKVGDLTRTCLGVDYSMTKNGNSPSIYIKAGSPRHEPMVEAVRRFSLDLLAGKPPHPASDDAVDDLDDRPIGALQPVRTTQVGTSFKRDPAVRAYALHRAGGRCEYCGAEGFLMPHGGHYLEAHHIIALADQGADTIENVIALCPGHHREAHFGATREAMEAQMVLKLNSLKGTP